MSPTVWIACIILLAALVLGYSGLKTYRDFKARNWFAATGGLVIAVTVPPLLLMVANLMWHLAHAGGL